MLNTMRMGEQEKKSLVTMGKVENSLNRKRLSAEYIRTAVWRLWVNKARSLDVKESLREKKQRMQLCKMRKV